MKRVITSALALTLLAGSAAVAQDRQGGQGRGGQREDRPASAQAQGGQGFQGRQGFQSGGQGAQFERRERDSAPPNNNPRGNFDAARERNRQEQQTQSRPDSGLAGGPDRQRAPDPRPDPRGQGERPDQRGPDRGAPDRDGRGGVNGGAVLNGARPGGDERFNGRPDNRPGQPGRGGPNDNRWDNRGDNRGPGVRPGDQRFRDRDRGRPQYDQRNFRPSYRAPQRFRGPVWRPPVGFYAYNWRFGDYLPRTWFGESYYLNWVAYGLPMPPIGAEWVRSGDDAILVDTWSGRVLSVYYDLFW